MNLPFDPQRKVFYTVIVGGYDQLRRPPDISGWEFVAFVDRPLHLLHRMINTFGKACGRGWDVRLLKADDIVSPALVSRLPKLLPHRFLGEFDYSLYADASIKFLQDPTHLAVDRGWPVFLAAEHPYRSNAYEEAAECVRTHKDASDVLIRQINFYSDEGLPHSVPLTANGLMFRRHMDTQLIALNEDWWRELMVYSGRDQISLPYVRWKHDFPIEAIDRQTYAAHVQVRSHGRSLLKRLKRSLNKRVARWGNV